jgi:hypothetical protein
MNRPTDTTAANIADRKEAVEQSVGELTEPKQDVLWPAGHALINIMIERTLEILKQIGKDGKNED